MSAVSTPHITLYHGRWCRSLRVRWLLEELGSPYKLVWKEYDPAVLQAPEYLKIHPFGQLPALTYGDITIWESGAIVEFLLAALPSKELTPTQPGTPEHARYLLYFHFAESLMVPVEDVIIHGYEHGKYVKEYIFTVAENAKARIARRLKWLDGEFAKTNPYILGATFSAADIMLGYSLTDLEEETEEFGADVYPHLKAYLARLKQRKAYRAACKDDESTA